METITQENTITQTVRKLGFANVYEFAYLRLYQIDKRVEEPKTTMLMLAVNQELENRGVILENYLAKELKDFLLEKINEYLQAIESFEQKYQMTWNEMADNLAAIVQIGKFDEFEIEDDYMNWVTFLDLVDSHKQTLKKIDNGHD